MIDVVSLGEKFNLNKETVSKNEAFEVIKCVENNLYKVTEEHRDQIRINLTNIIQNTSNKQKKIKHISHFDTQLNEKIEKTQKFLEENKNLMFNRADKGSLTVALNKAEYKNTVNVMLSDVDTYKLISSDPTKEVIDDLKKLLNVWESKEYINYLTYKRLFITSANLSRAYALPKIHKEKEKNLTYRIIVSSIGSPLHDLAKFLLPILKFGLQENNYMIKNSAEFINKINNIIIPEGHAMISFDVTALFTNTPKNMVIDSIKSRWHLIEPNTTIPWHEMESALILILNSNFFKFDGKYYQQIDGTPMGNPLSPIFVEFVMRDLEKNCIDNLDYDPLYYCRYVDDSFCIIPVDKIEYTKKSICRCLKR